MPRHAIMRHIRIEGDDVAGLAVVQAASRVEALHTAVCDANRKFRVAVSLKLMVKKMCTKQLNAMLTMAQVVRPVLSGMGLVHRHVSNIQYCGKRKLHNARLHEFEKVHR
jgi:hypothetical protein